MGSDPRSDEWRYSEGNEDAPPATPAEMPEVMTTPCPGCGRIGTVHTGTCPTRFTDQPKTPEAHENQYLRSELASLRAKLAEAEKYGAPVAGAVALSFIKNPCKKHDAYWTTSSGACMACRAADAEAKLAEWEAAGRVLAKYIYENGRGCGTRTAIEREDDLKIHRGNLYANPIASRLVAEAGGKRGD